MNAADELSDDEMRTNALNNPGLFLDLDDYDDDVVVSAALPTERLPTPPQAEQVAPSSQQRFEQQQPPAMQPGAASRFSGVGIPKLDVTALSTVPASAVQPMPAYGALGTTSSPMGYARDGTAEYLPLGFNAASQNSPSHNTTTSPNMTAFNAYSCIAGPPLCAKKLNFRDFLNQKAVSPHIESEESTGIFVGQLPSSYSEDDIEALLKAIGNEHGQTVQVRDVKSHNRDRTCAFISINASALSVVLDFTKRVLCDISCIWVVDHSQAAQLPIFIQQMPREHLRGVPKAALVLEKLTPQARSRHSGHGAQTGLATSPSAGYGGMQANIPSPMGNVGRPAYGQHPQMQQPSQLPPPPPPSMLLQGSGILPPTAFMDAVGFQATSPFNGPNFMAASSPGGNSMPQFFNPNAFQNPATPGMLFGANGTAPSPTSLYAKQMGGSSGIADVEAANQMMIAATRSRTNSLSHQLNIAPLSPSNGAGNAVPTAVQLTPALPQEHCSCGKMLFLSQYPENGRCAKCNSTIPQREVAYWCPNGHIAVCIMCALHTNLATDSNTGAKARFQQPRSETMLH